MEFKTNLDFLKIKTRHVQGNSSGLDKNDQFEILLFKPGASFSNVYMKRIDSRSRLMWSLWAKSDNNNQMMIIHNHSSSLIDV